MVVDTSAIITMLQNEKEADRLVSALEKANVIRMSTATLVETGIVMQARYGDPGEMEVNQFIEKVGITVQAVTIDHTELARKGYRNFGKGRHPASLNFGDCFSYALAVFTEEPLLFVGEDFSQTNVLIVKY